MPLRPKNSNALDILKSLELDENTNILVIEETETKTRVPIEFEIPAKLLPYLHDYLMHVRACINSGSKSTALWMSKAGGLLSEKGIRDVFLRHSARRFGFRLTPHDARDAAATTWAVFRPERIGVAQVLLTHKDLRTTTRYYNRAKGVEASRRHSKVLRKIASATLCRRLLQDPGRTK
jgi:integrase